MSTGNKNYILILGTRWCYGYDSSVVSGPLGFPFHYFHLFYFYVPRFASPVWQAEQFHACYWKRLVSDLCGQLSTLILDGA